MTTLEDINLRLDLHAGLEVKDSISRNSTVKTC